MRSLPLILGVAFLGGCTAIKSTVDLAQAESSLYQAAALQAAQHAPYEYTLAEQYLQKGREEQANSQHKLATQLAQRSQEWSTRATQAIEQGRLNLGAPDPDLRDEAPDPPPPKAAPPADLAEPEEPTDEAAPPPEPPADQAAEPEEPTDETADPPDLDAAPPEEAAAPGDAEALDPEGAAPSDPASNPASEPSDPAPEPKADE